MQIATFPLSPDTDSKYFCLFLTCLLDELFPAIIIQLEFGKMISWLPYGAPQSSAHFDKRLETPALNVCNACDCGTYFSSCYESVTHVWLEWNIGSKITPEPVIITLIQTSLPKTLLLLWMTSVRWPWLCRSSWFEITARCSCVCRVACQNIQP